MPDAPKDPVLFTFFNEIGIIEQLARCGFEKVLPDGMTVSQFSVLNHFARLGGEKSPARLAGAFQVTKGAMTNTLQRLEARGLVRIRPDPADGRAKLVSLTRKGRKVRDGAVKALVPMLQRLSHRLPERRFAEALPFLKELRAFLDEDRNPPPGDTQS